MMQIISPVRRLTDRMNCSVVCLPLESAGQLTANGSYDGGAGAVQRNEIDMLLAFWRSDFFPIVAGHTTTQGFPADVLIISRRNDSYLLNYQLLEMWTSKFDNITIACVLICLHLFLTVLLATENWQITDSHFGVVAHLCKAWNRNTFKVFASIVDQENFDATSDSGMIIVWFFNLFLLFGVHGIMLGSMGADLVTVVDPPVINSLYEFTNTSYTQPVVMKQFFIPPVLEKSTPGSELRHLKHVLDANQNENMLSFNVSEPANMQEGMFHLIEQVDDSRKAVICPEAMYDNIQTAACELVPHLAKNMGRSKRLFASGVFVVIMSLKIDPDLRQVINYVFGTLIETGQLKGYLLALPSIVLPSLTGQRYKGRSCDKQQREGQSVSAFGTKTFDPIFRGYAILLLLSAFVFLMEGNGRIHRHVVKSLKTRAKTQLRWRHLVRHLQLIPSSALFGRAITRRHRIGPRITVTPAVDLNFSETPS